MHGIISKPSTLTRVLIAAAIGACMTMRATWAEPISITLEFEPDLDNGRQVYAICATCHLPEGWGNADGTYPQLAGQHRNVLIRQLLNIRDGKRDNPLMYPFVQERTIGGYQSLADVVAYIATLPMTPEHDLGPWAEGSEEYTTGQRIYASHCAACHGPEGLGNNSHYYPRLQGQHYSYMVRQIDLVKRILRRVDPAMEAVVKTLDDTQLRYVLNYVSRLPVAKQDLAPSIDWRNPDFR